MSVPLRKNEPELEENLTTADLAQGKGPVSDDGPREDRPQPVLAGRPTGEIVQQNVQTAPTDVRNTDVGNRTGATPLFPHNELESCEIAGAAFKPLSSTSLAAPSNKQTAWSLPQCNVWRKCLPKKVPGSNSNGTAATTSPPKTCVSLCSAIVLSSNACYRSKSVGGTERRSRAAPPAIPVAARPI